MRFFKRNLARFSLFVTLVLAVVGFISFLVYLDGVNNQELPASTFPAFQYAKLEKPSSNLPSGDVLYIAMPNTYGGPMTFPLYILRNEFLSSSQYALDDMDPGFDILSDCSALVYPKGSSLLVVQPDTGITVREYRSTYGSYLLPTFSKNRLYLAAVRTWNSDTDIFRSIEVTEWTKGGMGFTSLFTMGSPDGAFAPSNLRWFGPELAWMQSTVDDPYFYRAYATDVTTKVTRPISLAEYQTFWSTPQYDLEISRDAAIQKGCTPEKG